MYQDLFKDVKNNFQPMLDVAAINRKTLARMASVQTQCLSEFISTGMNQAKDLSTAGDVKTIADLQFKYLREFESQLAASAEENISVMSDAKDEISEILSSSYGRLAENIQLGEKMVKSAAETATSAAESATKAMPSKDKAPARAAKSGEGPKVETNKQETTSEAPKVETKAEDKPEAKAKTEDKSESKGEAKTSTSQAEAKRDADKEEASKVEVKSEGGNKGEFKAESGKGEVKAEAGKDEDTKSEAKSASSKSDTDTKSKSSSSAKR